MVTTTFRQYSQIVQNAPRKQRKLFLTQPTCGNQNYLWHCSVPEVILVPTCWLRPLRCAVTDSWTVPTDFFPLQKPSPHSSKSPSRIPQGSLNQQERSMQRIGTESSSPKAQAYRNICAVAMIMQAVLSRRHIMIIVA